MHISVCAFGCISSARWVFQNPDSTRTLRPESRTAGRCPPAPHVKKHLRPPNTTQTGCRNCLWGPRTMANSHGTKKCHTFSIGTKAKTFTKSTSSPLSQRPPTAGVTHIHNRRFAREITPCSRKSGGQTPAAKATKGFDLNRRSILCETLKNAHPCIHKYTAPSPREQTLPWNQDRSNPAL